MVCCLSISQDASRKDGDPTDQTTGILRLTVERYFLNCCHPLAVERLTAFPRFIIADSSFHRSATPPMNTQDERNCPLAPIVL